MKIFLELKTDNGFQEKENEQAESKQNTILNTGSKKSVSSVRVKKRQTEANVPNIEGSNSTDTYTSSSQIQDEQPQAKDGTGLKRPANKRRKQMAGQRKRKGKGKRKDQQTKKK